MQCKNHNERGNSTAALISRFRIIQGGIYYVYQIGHLLRNQPRNHKRMSTKLQYETRWGKQTKKIQNKIWKVLVSDNRNESWRTTKVSKSTRHMSFLLLLFGVNFTYFFISKRNYIWTQYLLKPYFRGLSQIFKIKISGLLPLQFKTASLTLTPLTQKL